MKKLLCIMLFVMLTLGNFTVFAETIPESENLPDFGNIFEPYLTNSPPEILNILSETELDGVKQTEVQFSSCGGKNKIYAKIYAPSAEGVYPGIALFHWGDGSAQSQASLALFLARKGYAVITPDLPGIGNPEKMPFSDGSFKELGYTEIAQFEMNSNPKNSTIFQAVIAALDSVYLLKSLDCTDSTRTGLSGDSWGGFTALKLAGLLGKEISCVYSLYGTAFLDFSTHWSENVFPHFEETNKTLFMKYLDVSSNISDITCPVFIESPTNDSYFYIPSAEKTAQNIKNFAGHAYVANANHTPHPWNFPQRLGFFDYYLKDNGVPFLKISDVCKTEEAPLGLSVKFDVPDNRSIRARVFFADADSAFCDKKWSSVSATVKNGKAEALIPYDVLFNNTVFYGYATDENRFYASTKLCTAENLNPRSLSLDEKLSLVKPVTIINDSDEECVKSGAWNLSYYSGYEEQSICSDEPEAFATYTPFLKDGKYKISVFAVADGTNPVKIQATINSAEGETKTSICTELLNSKWIALGEFDFFDGKSGSVTLMPGSNPEQESLLTHLDAVRFEYVGERTRNILIYIDKQKLELPKGHMPVTINERTLVPVRSILETLDIPVYWDAESMTVVCKKPGAEICFKINSNTATVNGTETELDVPAQIINDRTYIPLRFLSEALGFTVSWNNKLSSVSLTTKGL